MRLTHRLMAELIGTFTLVFAGCGAVMVAERFPGSIHPAVVPVVFGLVVAAMIYSLGHISGAHINPAVTFAFALVRHFPRKEILPYWVAQISGSVAAIALLAFILPEGSSYGATLPAVPVVPSLLWEMTLTFVLMFVVMSVATDTRAVGNMAGAAIAATVTLCAFVGGPVTGASMNPARSFGPALFEGTLSSFWIYLVGPIVGAALAGVCYEWIRGVPRSTEEVTSS